ncbi:hypothetical protein S40285_04697 [Stachybotrys chlorohalonatus IBT 40285]|uniref:Uncharacterized protein n=1 Tax=Stachybotrys chlorohalonatus (strain IBT 40285) TaxID=1283841 RepID=A0A084R317_STAC4|nr:hypothetical protein S40285_04697 [Stachybotrys chlorohalonata IBT 40285]
MSPYTWILRTIHVFEDRIIEAILRQPSWHRFVGRIHRSVHERQYGRNPHEPLAPGEATADPDATGRSTGFLKHFVDELRNQARGRPSDVPREPPKK